jgi:hypothetical protein
MSRACPQHRIPREVPVMCGRVGVPCPPYLPQPRIHHEVPVMCGRVGVPCPPPTHPRSSARVVPECAHLHCWVDLNTGVRLETESPAPLMLAP